MLALRSACWIGAAAVMAVILIQKDYFGGLDRGERPRRRLCCRRRALCAGTSRRSIYPAKIDQRAQPARVSRYSFRKAPRLHRGNADRLCRVAGNRAIRQSWPLLPFCAACSSYRNRFGLACAALYILARIFLVGPYLGRDHAEASRARVRCLSLRSRVIGPSTRHQPGRLCGLRKPVAIGGRPARSYSPATRQGACRQIPNHNEGLLDTVFGARTSSPAPHRPWVDHAASAV